MIRVDWRRRPREVGANPEREIEAVPISRGGRVSVIIPLYNHARYIAAAIESVLAQGAILHEIIVVDDGSQDDSAAIMRSLAHDQPRIVFWSQSNRGAHAAINAGLHRATGEYLSVLNSDDVYSAGRLQRLADMLDADDGADMAASGLSFIDAEGASVTNNWFGEALDFYRARADMALALVNGNFLMTTSNFLFRRRLLDTVGQFANLRYAHDLDFALRVLATRRRLAFTEDPLVQYRIHDQNTIAEGHDKVKVEWAAVTAFFLTSLWERPDSGPMDWTRAVAFQEVLERHALLRPVQLCMTYFRQHPTDTLEHNPFLEDRTFQTFLAEMMR